MLFAINICERPRRGRKAKDHRCIDSDQNDHNRCVEYKCENFAQFSMVQPLVVIDSDVVNGFCAGVIAATVQSSAGVLIIYKMPRTATYPRPYLLTYRICDVVARQKALRLIHVSWSLGRRGKRAYQPPSKPCPCGGI